MKFLIVFSLLVPFVPPSSDRCAGSQAFVNSVRGGSAPSGWWPAMGGIMSRTAKEMQAEWQEAKVVRLNTVVNVAHRTTKTRWPTPTGGGLRAQARGCGFPRTSWARGAAYTKRRGATSREADLRAETGPVAIRETGSASSRLVILACWSHWQVMMIHLLFVLAGQQTDLEGRYTLRRGLACVWAPRFVCHLGCCVPRGVCHVGACQRFSMWTLMGRRGMRSRK